MYSSLLDSISWCDLLTPCFDTCARCYFELGYCKAEASGLTSATHLISAYVQPEPILRAQVLGRLGPDWAGVMSKA